jgi:ATP-dependent DNA helicase PIF1
LAHDANARDAVTLASRCILTPKNGTVDDVNEMIMDIFGGEERTYLSADSAEDAGDNTEYAAEFPHTLNPSGMPPHKLRLMIGTPIILLRNLNAQEGMANGTRLIVERLMHRCLQARIMNGSHACSSVLIPRVPCTPSRQELPFMLTRVQFPVRVAFAMTIKQQGAGPDAGARGR